MKKLVIISSLIIYSLADRSLYAQGIGSVETIGGTGQSALGNATGNTKSSASESLYIGPGNYLVDGTWEIYSKNVVIDPNAIISGAGSIVFLNPSVAGGASSPTIIDGNNALNATNVNIVLQNASGMQLANIDFPADLVSAGFTNDATTSTLYIGADLNLAVSGANITLGTGVVGDLRFDSDATISNYGTDRMIITNNSILSHMVKDSYTGSFTFPMGITAGDYTPAQVNNTIANGIHLSVQNYAASAPDESLLTAGNGMERTWNLYADNASGNSTLTLQHNNITNQNAFNDASHFITRNGILPNNTGDNPSLSSWQSNTLGAGVVGDLSSTGTVAGSSMMSRSYTDFATAAATDIAYLSKSSHTIAPLPVNLLSFTGTATGCNTVLYWKTAAERNVSHFDIEQSAEGAAFSVIGRVAATNNADGSQYHFETKALSNVALYRLSIVDFDGSITKSKIISVNTQCPDNGNSWTLFPNPVNANAAVVVRVNAGRELSGAKIVIVNMLGQKLMEHSINILPGINDYQLPVVHWAKGAYIVSLIDSNGERVMGSLQLQLR